MREKNVTPSRQAVAQAAENALTDYSALAARLARTSARTAPPADYKALEQHLAKARVQLFALAEVPYMEEGAFFDTLEAYTVCVEQFATTPEDSVPADLQARLQATRRRVVDLLNP